MKSYRGATPVSRIFFVSKIEGAFRRITTGQQRSARILANPPTGRTGFAAGNPENDLSSRNRGEQ